MVFSARVRDVVAFDAQGRAGQVEVLRELLQRLRARRNVTRTLRAMQGEGLPGVLRDRLHKLSLRTALGHVHRHGRAARLPQPARNRLLILGRDRNQHFAWNRRGGSVRNVVHAHGRHLHAFPSPGLVR